MKEFLCKLFGCDEPRVVIKEVYLDNPKIEINNDTKLLSFTDTIRTLGFVEKNDSYTLYGKDFIKNDMFIRVTEYGNYLYFYKDEGYIGFLKIDLPNFNDKHGYRKLKKIIEWAESIPDDIKHILKEGK